MRMPRLASGACRRVALLGVGALIGLVRSACCHVIRPRRPGSASRGHAHRPIPAVRFQLSVHSSSGRRGASKATTERVARIVCLSERDGRDSDLSCVPNEKRPFHSRSSTALSRRYSMRRPSRRPNEPSVRLLLLAVALQCGWSSLSVR